MSAEDAIRQMAADWLQATRQGGKAGAEGYASFATKDAVFLPPNSERLEGPDAIAEAMVEITSLDGFDISWDVSRIDLAADGDHATILGEFELSFQDADGNTVSDRGKFFDSVKKQEDGSWRCKVACWNSSMPLA